MTIRKTRDSGIELLRILTMLGVVMLHYNDGRAFVHVASGSPQELSLFFLESICICAVDLYILISGYYLSASQKRSLLKPLKLIVELMVIRIVHFGVSVFVDHAAFRVQDFVKCLIPTSYFVILYTALYLISPYVNLCIKNLNSKQFRQFMLTLIIVFSLWNTVVDFVEELLGRDFFGLSTITAWGSKQGFNIGNFVLLYILGAFLRQYPIPDRLKNKRLLTLIWAATVVCIFAWASVCSSLTRTELRSAWVYHNPLVILSAALLFLLFNGTHFHSRIVNEFAAATFTCFLIHGYLLDYLDIQKAVQGNLPKMLLHILLVLPGIYLCSWVVYKVYHVASAWFFKLLGTLDLFKSKEIPSEFGGTK